MTTSMYIFTALATLLVLLMKAKTVVSQDEAPELIAEPEQRQDSTTIQVKVQLYAEALCPFCRQFITQAWQPVWLDVEGLRPHIDFDFVPWGNAYFVTAECGSGPYSSTERACWYKKCMATNEREEADADCFTGDAVYQHGPKEGDVDIYESCIKQDFGLEAAMTFTFCAEGKILDNDDILVEQLLNICAIDIPEIRTDMVQMCKQHRGKMLEVQNAKQTPEHPGVPFVLLDGQPVEDPMAIQKEICETLHNKGLKTLPDSCTGNYQTEEKNTFIRGSLGVAQAVA